LKEKSYSPSSSLFLLALIKAQLFLFVKGGAVRYCKFMREAFRFFLKTTACPGRLWCSADLKS